MAMETIELHFTSVLGIEGVNHIYVHSPVTGQSAGRRPFTQMGAFGNPIEGVISTQITSRQRRKIFRASVWKKGIYVPYINDCHTYVQMAFKEAGVKYPAMAKRIGRHEDWTKTYTIEELNRAFELAINAKNEVIMKEIADLIVRYARSHHKYHDNTGKLTQSIRARSYSPGVIEISANVNYSDDVIERTNDNFLRKAVEDNIGIIQEIINRNVEQSIRENEFYMRAVAERLGEQIMRDQFQQVTNQQTSTQV